MTDEQAMKLYAKIAPLFYEPTMNPAHTVRAIVELLVPKKDAKNKKKKKEKMVLTYQEWNTKGYYVMKGQKSKVRNEQGQPVFDRKQVAKFTQVDCGYDEMEDAIGRYGPEGLGYDAY